MRKVQLKYATSAVIGILGAAIIVLAGIRTFVTGEAPATLSAQLFNEAGCIQCHLVLPVLQTFRRRKVIRPTYSM